jgi:hypothetical protein
VTDTDEREALYNDRPRGPAARIQVTTEQVTRLHAILLDLDPGLLAPGNPVFPPADAPDTFFEAVRPALDRHPLCRHAEARVSGTGLHVLVPLEPPAELRSPADQKRWAALVRAVQASLPSDHQAPGITALTRPVGSVNSKNGAAVRLLRPGTPVEPAVVEAYTDRLREAPFRTVAVPLLGGERASPCPVCGGAGTRLDVLDRHGRCYGGCGTVTLPMLYDRAFRAPPAPAGKKKPDAPAVAAGAK